MHDPKPVRAYAAWHPDTGIDHSTVSMFEIGSIQKLNSWSNRGWSTDYEYGWRIIPVDIVPVKEKGDGK